MDGGEADMIGDLLLREGQAVPHLGAIDAQGGQPVAQLQQERGEPFFSVCATEAHIPVMQMALVLGELPGEDHCDGEILGCRDNALITSPA